MNRINNQILSNYSSSLNKPVRLALTLIPILFTSLFAYIKNVQAAKIFVQKKTTVYRKTAAKSSIPSAVSYRSDKQGILFSFTNFTGLESVTYSFTYSSNGIQQGAGGTITSVNNPTSSRELLFGTCSSGVCTYHRNLSNAKLVLTAKLTNGKRVSKIYRIKTYQ